MATIVQISRTTKHHEDVLKIERIEPEVDSRTTYVMPIDGSVDIDVFGKNVSQLIERDMPKKPHTRQFYGAKIHICPSCRRHTAKLNDFCHKCGQRFDWR